jgi:hypothetical protein
MQALHNDGEDGYHHKIGGMVIEFTVELKRWRPLKFQRPYYSKFDMIIYVFLMFTFLPYYFICVLHVVDVFSR